MMRSALVTLALLAVLAGCEDPYNDDATDSPGRSNVVRPQGDDPPPRDGSRDAAPAFGTAVKDTPEAVVRAFCSQWSNWDWRTIARQQQRLAALATGALGRGLAAEAALRAHDRALRRDRLGARGRVVTIDVKRGWRVRDAVCVASQEQVARGRVDLEGARYRVYLATVARTNAGWAVTRWEPQP
jgi:hypothetical protein